MRAALDVLPADVGEIVVLSGDVPLMDPDLDIDAGRPRARDRRQRDGARIGGRRRARQPRTRGAGRGRTRLPHRGGEGRHREDELAIDEINAGLYAFDVAWLREQLPGLGRPPA